MIRGSNEELFFTLSDRYGKDITGDAVTVAIVDRSTTDLTGATWLPATHVSGDQWRTTSAIAFTSAAYPESSYHVYANDGGVLHDLGVLTIGH